MTVSTTLLTAPGTTGIKGNRWRVGSGAPSASTVANDGDPYYDSANNRIYGPRVNGTWPTSFVSNVGKTGPAGQLTFPAPPLNVAYNVAPGPSCGFVTGRTLTGTQNASVPATSIDHTFSPLVAGALGAVTISNNPNSAQTIVAQLYNLTTSSVVYTSPSVPPSSVISLGVFALSTYPMTAGNQYVWQFVAQGSGNVAALIMPSYYVPGENSVCTGWMPPVYYTGTAGSPIAANGVGLVVQGSLTFQGFSRFQRAAFLYTAIFTNSTNQPCTFTYNGYTSPSIPAGAVVSVGPLTPTTPTFPAASSQLWNVVFANAAVGQVAVQWQVGF